jgi:hypothetical protein
MMALPPPGKHIAVYAPCSQHKKHGDKDKERSREQERLVKEAKKFLKQREFYCGTAITLCTGLLLKSGEASNAPGLHKSRRPKLSVDVQPPG